jgi:hypothetical protein
MKKVGKQQAADRTDSRIITESGNRALSSSRRADISPNVPIDKHLDRLSFILDKAIKVPGTDIRFGLDPIISFFFPVAGDTVATLMSAYIVLVSVRYGLPKSIIARMVYNVGVDYAIGSVPLLGDLFDFTWKSNDKNMRLLNKHATGEGKSLWSDWVWVLVLLGLLGLVALGILVFLIYAVSKSGLL